MKIAVLDIAASKTGALSILTDFYNYIRQNPDDNEWIFITGVKDILGSAENIRVECREDVKSSSAARLRFDLFTGAEYIKSLGADVLFSLQNTLPRGTDGIRTVLYVHQPLGFQSVRKFSFFKGSERHMAVYQYLIAPMINSSVKRADSVIVQTEWMKDAVIKKTGVSPEKVRKILPDVPVIADRYCAGKWNCREFFYPAGNIPYKNHVLIKEAIEILNGQGYNDIKVHYTLDKNLSREEVFDMYNKCTLLFPSYIETFGLPMAEARQFGNPILASDMPFSHEVLEGYANAAFFDPFDANALASDMKMVLDGKMIPGVPDRTCRNESSACGEIVKQIRGLQDTPLNRETNDRI